MSAQSLDAIFLLIDTWRGDVDAERLIAETETYLRRLQ